MIEDLVSKIATVYFQLDETLQMNGVSPLLAETISGVEGQNLLDVFMVQKPRRTKSFEAISAKIDSLFLLIAKDKSIAYRGQFIHPDKSEKTLIFMGAPWAVWLTEHKPDSSLQAEHFSILDSQLDQLMLMSTQQQNMEDLEGLAHDLRLAKDEADTARKAQAEFFAVMSHEMRTPLNGVSTALNLMHIKKYTAEDYKMWSIAEQSARNLQDVVDHVLNYSKLQAGGFSNTPVDFDLRELVHTVETMLFTKAAANESRISTLVDDSLPEMIKADESKLRQILINLVSNAVKFTFNGDIVITLRPGRSAQTILAEVVDTGIGIAPESIEKVFDPYWTLGTKDTNTKGTGLGLKISREFAGLLGGELKCHSRLGNGSNFNFEFPYEVGEKIVTRIKADAVATYRGRVLVAEDNPTNQYLARTLLERRGIEVTIANNGLEALAAVEKHNFDLVFMDISMPEMGGIEASQCLRKTHGSKQLPIVALTAHAEKSDVELFMAVGMNGVLLKPVDFKMLDQYLAEYLEQLDKIQTPDLAVEVLGEISVFDTELAQKLITEVAISGYHAVAELFLTELSAKVDGMLNAKTLGDFTKIAKLAHSIHSSAMMLGCSQLGINLKNTELAVKADQNETAEQLLDRLSVLAQASADALKTYLLDHPA